MCLSSVAILLTYKFEPENYAVCTGNVSSQTAAAMRKSLDTSHMIREFLEMIC